MESTFYSLNTLADILGTSVATVQKWGESGIYPLHKDEKGRIGFISEDLMRIDAIRDMNNGKWYEEIQTKPNRIFTSVELFAGAGGLALGLDMAGLHHVLLNEFDEQACNTLRANKPDWNVLERDIHNVDFSPLYGKIDLLSGGFPCQAFSYAGKKGGLNDTRGTLFFELARAVNEIKPKVFLCENVKGLQSHDGGKTLEIIRNAIKELGYTLVEPRVLKAVMYQVPQKRERIILVAIRNDYAEKVTFKWPSPYHRVMTLRDAFFKGELFSTDVPKSEGVLYPEKKRRVMKMVPEGGDWRDLPIEEQKAYMGGSFYLGGGKTGMARRLSMDEPSLTLVCSPAQKQTERCHPKETRPLNIREYARIQTFPDSWKFMGTLSDQYKQIGNAVPVNLAYAVGRAIVRLLNEIDNIDDVCPSKDDFAEANKIAKSMLPSRPIQLDLLALFEQYKDGVLAEPKIAYKSQWKNLLISLVSGKLSKEFDESKGSVYYTGSKFPSTISLQKLQLFVPYIKGKGVRDLYRITKIRVASKREVSTNAKESDYRIFFELKFMRKLFDDYHPINLNIWRTYNYSSLDNILDE
ncbi:MAG: DNA (cytosine-5-)-methyltransferase [Muribaculaceae bacterium]|nr:DNA (cytosine-5-)-methyltransferase [Muribaculaceae bacterium]